MTKTTSAAGRIPGTTGAGAGIPAEAGAAPGMPPATDAAGQTLSVADAVLRQGFRYGNKFMLLMWRLGLHRWGMSNPYLGYIMVLTHTGRKSGLRRRTPVNFAEIGGDLAEIGGDLYCLAGFGAAADWYRNLLANPQVEVWLPDGSWYAGTAADISRLPDPQRLPILRQVLINSGFAGLLAGLRPHTMSDAALKQATAAYKLVRVRRTAPRTGSGGPGDLASVWIVIAALLAVLAVLALLPRRNRRPA